MSDGRGVGYLGRIQRSGPAEDSQQCRAGQTHHRCHKTLLEEEAGRQEYHPHLNRGT